VPADVTTDYLSTVAARLRLNRAEKEEIAEELATHLTDSIRDHQKRGLRMQEAQEKAVEDFGDPKDISRKLNWIHGFGWYSKRPWIDALLGSVLILVVPAGYSLLQKLIPALEPFPAIAVLFLVAAGITIYAYRAAVPAWTVTWLGSMNLLVLTAAYVGVCSGVKAFQVGQLHAQLAGMAAACIALFATTFYFSKKHLELTLLFLLPLAFPYIVLGYEDTPPEHGLFVLPIVGIFWVGFAFFYLLTRNQHPVLFACLGFLFYTGLYVDIVLNSPAPLNASGLRLAFIWALLYGIPLITTSSPAYHYLKRRTTRVGADGP
jgi:hypothetical protein